MKNNRKVQIFKIVLALIVLGLMIGLTIYFIPFIKQISTTEGQIAFKEELDSKGCQSIIILFGLQIVQMFLAVIPGGPIEVIAGMCYGTVKGTIFIIISSAIVAALIFLLVRKFGRDFIYSFCNEEQVKKIENSKIFQNPKKVEMIMAIIFLIPGTPKDLLTYVAGLLPINPFRFIAISIIARMPTIIASTYGGAKLTDGNWQITLIANGIVFIIAVIVIFIYNKFDKDKTAEKAIKILNKK